jgi:ribosome-binding protein aMBF1 (putative translation factor)
MPKYSTGGSSGGGDAGACELCGSTTDDLRTASVAGATLDVCPDCAPHDDATESGGGDGGDDTDADRRKRAAQNVAQMSDAGGGDSSHWEEEGTDYEADRLPYLVSDYGARVEQARQEAGYQRDELAAELDVDENVLLAVEQGRATRAGVGGSVVRALEAELGVDLVDE